MVSRLHYPLRTAFWLFVGLVAWLSVSGCGVLPVNVVQPLSIQSPSTLTSKIISYQQSVRAEVNQPATATATCAAGEQVIGGSLSADIFEADSVLASYPSSTTAWTVIAESPASFIILSVQVYCVPANFPLGIQVLQGPGRVACPDGSVLVNGGFQGSAETSRPDGNGWTSDGTTTYVLCATQHLAVARSVSALEQLPPGFGANGGGDVKCGKDQVATGGGFSGGQYSPTFFGPDDSFTGWAISSHANNFSSPQPAPVIWAVCNEVLFTEA